LALEAAAAMPGLDDAFVFLSMPASRMSHAHSPCRFPPFLKRFGAAPPELGASSRAGAGHRNGRSPNPVRLDRL